MKLEEINVIWNSQKEEPMFVIDQQALHASVERQGASVDRRVGWFELSMIFVGFTTAVILPIDAWLEGDGFHQYIVAVLCLAFGVYALLGRKWRLEKEVVFDRSMLGIIERALSQLDYHMNRLKTFLWCFNLPIALAAAIGLTIYGNTHTPWVWAGVILVCAISYWGTRRDIRKKFLPEKRDLEALRDKLITGD